MPSEIEHIDKWRHNRRYLASIPEQYSDWRANAAFYTALHAVEAYFAGKLQRHCHNHESRDVAVQNNLAPVYQDYHQLYNASRLARYMVHGIKKFPLFNTFMPAKVVVRTLIGQKLRKLELHIIQGLALSADDFPELLFSDPPTTPTKTG